MQSLRQLYKIGHGPSSSHTMGPQKAAQVFLERFPNASYEVDLYGSLSLTGKGHLTDWILEQTLPGVRVHFRSDFLEAHPNALDFKAIRGDTQIGFMRVYSVGGGDIVIEGETALDEAYVYKERTFAEIKAVCQRNDWSLFEYVCAVEGDDIKDFLHTVWQTMKRTVERGLQTEGVLPGRLKVVRKAGMLYRKKPKHEVQEIKESRLVSAYAFAVNEENAAGGEIVTAPTCGAAGTVPAVLYYMQERHGFSDEQIAKALGVAGLIGNLIKHNASISGAEAGCQAEVGSACSMAAAAHATLFKLSINQIEYAAEIALEHHLGLTCDPIGGYVQIPCIERNAVAAMRAIHACGLAYFLSDTRKIDFDTIIETMYQTGKDMPASYRETSCGGLAVYYKEKED